MPQVETLIIGGGLAGLAAAVHLQQKGRPFALLEASDQLGGRVRTDRVDGFLLDRGFQVYIDSYPTARKLFDHGRLGLRSFDPGALVWKRGKVHRLMDVFRRPGHLFETALAPVGTMVDKLRVGRLRARLLRKSVDDIWTTPESTAYDLLRDEGFSAAMIDEFFGGFYGGIFLEDSLVTSSRMFEFTFSMFSRGLATLPADGMQALPTQLAAHLPADSIHLETAATAIEGNQVHSTRGDWQADHIILAVDASAAHRIFPSHYHPIWRSTTCLYYSAPRAPYADRLIMLRGDLGGLIHHLAVLSNVQPSYAPAGRALVSVTLIEGHIPDEDLAGQVSEELRDWFGPVTRDWELLRCEQIRQALPVDAPGHQVDLPRKGPVTICGDHTLSASIEGAVLSGIRAASDPSEFST